MADGLPEESPAEDDRIVLVNYAETMPEDFHRNIVNLYGVDVDEETYAVFFTSFADNVLPSVRVVARGEGASA